LLELGERFLREFYEAYEVLAFIARERRTRRGELTIGQNGNSASTSSSSSQLGTQSPGFLLCCAPHSFESGVSNTERDEMLMVSID
jgi:hypothetical protein